MELAAYAQNKADDKNYISGHLQSPLNDETSGIASSAVQNDIYYINNDSGDTSRFFAITPQGKLKGVFYFNGVGEGKLGVKDCEDIAVGPGPQDGISYVYIADIGDNDSSKPFITIYRVPEPTMKKVTDSIYHVNSTPLYIKYPDGPRDAETLMIDPLEKLFYIITKRGKTVEVYTAPLQFNLNDTTILTKRTQLKFNGLQPFKWIVSGDISKDGTQVVLKSYSRVYYWRRNGAEPIWQTLQRKPQQPAYEQERLGEAIGFAPNGKSYYTVSEGNKQPIYHYGVPKP
ncbi:hypothetical protein ACFQ3S_12685 [Mucilaginibacter terrae]|uniref:hypothetical protein n=1 Tax=Mucilaginibacter terrae TaxID=1955052 RepID=UPI003630580B